MRVFGIGCLCLFALVGCAFSIPDPPTTTHRLLERTPPARTDHYHYEHEYDILSPLSQLLLSEFKHGDPHARFALDAAWRCENRLNTLVGRMRYARNSRSAITITGGILTIAGALLTSVLVGASAAADEGEDTERLDTAAVISAGVTAGTSITTLLGTQIGDPAELKLLYEGSLAHYTRAYDYVMDLRRLKAHETEEWDSVMTNVLRELNRCSEETIVPKASRETPSEDDTRGTEPAPAATFATVSGLHASATPREAVPLPR